MPIKYKVKVTDILYSCYVIPCVLLLNLTLHVSFMTRILFAKRMIFITNGQKHTIIHIPCMLVLK